MRRAPGSVKSLNPFVWFFLAACFALLFVGGPDYYSPRSWEHAWNLGHILFFGACTSLLLRSALKFGDSPFLRQCVIVLLLAFVAGSAIEVAQIPLGRTFSLVDIRRDILGALLALFFLAPGRKKCPPSVVRLLRIALLVLVVLEAVPLGVSLVDESLARRQFPVLSDFETPFETGRWKSRLHIRRDNRTASGGKYSLRVTLDTAEYSGIALKYFTRDWTKYRFLRFSLHHGGTGTLRIVCRVHDALHEDHGQAYHDRYNESFTLTPGWNDIEIPLERISEAPRGREMDLKRIRGLGLFAVRLPEPRILHIDNVRLAGKSPQERP